MAQGREIEVEIALGRSFFLVLLVALALATVAPTSHAHPRPAPAVAPLGWATIPGRYYLTVERYQGDGPLTACAPGYHMASLWEILDPSNLRYDTTLGVTTADSGDGPPTGVPSEYGGWVRTGYSSDTGPVRGQANCNAWMSNDPTHNGTLARLRDDWSSPGTDIGEWDVGVSSCGGSYWRVWCVRPPFHVYLPLILKNYGP